MTERTLRVLFLYSLFRTISFAAQKKSFEGLVLYISLTPLPRLPPFGQTLRFLLGTKWGALRRGNPATRRDFECSPPFVTATPCHLSHAGRDPHSVTARAGQCARSCRNARKVHWTFRRMHCSTPRGGQVRAYPFGGEAPAQRVVGGIMSTTTSWDTMFLRSFAGILRYALDERLR